MSFHLTLLDDDAAPFSPGLRLELIGDGEIIGRATIDNNGDVLFDSSTEGVARLAVRLDREQDLTAPKSIVA